MILADSEMKRRIKNWEIEVTTISKYDVLQQIGPASLDFRLGNTFKVFRRSKQTVIDSKIGPDSEHISTIILEDGDRFVLHPGDFVLGATLEKIKVPYDLVVRCEGRSSIGRLGVIIHSTAGFIDPGFEGTVTLEMTNINELPVCLYAGMRIGQFAFEAVQWEVLEPYDTRKGSKYMHQVDPEASRIDSDLY
jgi:dCTP deaminase